MPGAPGLIVINYTPRPLKPAGATRIYLYPLWPLTGGILPGNTPTVFPNPGNWNPTNNKIECLGSGGIGVQGFSGDVQGNAGSGGGGGGYAWDVNLNPTFPVSFRNFLSEQAPDDDQYSSTWWNGYVAGAGNIIGGFGHPAYGFVGSGAGNSAPGGGGGTSGGEGTSTNYPANQSFVGGGGGGGGAIASVVTGGGSGGGAAGPHGAGLAGANGGNGQILAGGAGDAGNTPGVVGGSTNGNQWDRIHGVGSGASSGAAGVAAPPPGQFGGGGGGGWSTGASNAGSTGGYGLIVITYTPLLYVPPQGQAQIMA